VCRPLKVRFLVNVRNAGGFCDRESGQCDCTNPNRICDNINCPSTKCTTGACDVATGQCTQKPIVCPDLPCQVSTGCNEQDGCTYTDLICPGMWGSTDARTITHTCPHAHSHHTLAPSHFALARSTHAHALTHTRNKMCLGRCAVTGRWHLLSCCCCLPCADVNACRLGVCNTTTGLCTTKRVWCDDGDPCTSMSLAWLGLAVLNGRLGIAMEPSGPIPAVCCHGNQCAAAAVRMHGGACGYQYWICVGMNTSSPVGGMLPSLQTTDAERLLDAWLRPRDAGRRLIATRETAPASRYGRGPGSGIL
jgi:hypothetical protein